METRVGAKVPGAPEYCALKGLPMQKRISRRNGGKEILISDRISDRCKRFNGDYWKRLPRLPPHESST
jgi:hypothetical protein